MDAVNDKHLFYIAEWALTAPLPDGWVEQTEAIPGESGKAVVYHNTASGVRTYEHPSDAQYRAYYRSMKAQEEPPKKVKGGDQSDSWGGSSGREGSLITGTQPVSTRPMLEHLLLHAFV